MRSKPVCFAISSSVCGSVLLAANYLEFIFKDHLALQGSLNEFEFLQSYPRDPPDSIVLYFPVIVICSAE